MKRIYLDSNVFISLVNEEINGRIRPLFIEARLFFNEVKKRGDVLVLSEFFFREVEKICYMRSEDVLVFFEQKGIRLEIIEEKENLNTWRFKQKGLHSSDAAHAAIAIKHNCDCIVTFNLKDFEKISEFIKIFLPAGF